MSVRTRLLLPTEINFCLKVGTGISFSKPGSYSHVKICQHTVKYTKPQINMVDRFAVIFGGYLASLAIRLGMEKPKAT